MKRRPGLLLALLWLLLAAFWFAMTAWAVELGGWTGLWPIFPALLSVGTAIAVSIGLSWRRTTFASFVLGLLFIVIAILDGSYPYRVGILGFGLALAGASVMALRGFSRLATGDRGLDR